MTRRTTLDVDDVLLGQAQQVLGTTGLRDTVEAAFHDVVRRALRLRLAARIETGVGIDRSTDLLDVTRPAR